VDQRSLGVDGAPGVVAADDGQSDRLVFTFFHQPNYDARIEVLPTCCSEDDPPRYGTTTSGEHITRKILAMRSPELGA
jgi:isopenicillin N synthase-like dioxygenase